MNLEHVSFNESAKNRDEKNKLTVYSTYSYDQFKFLEGNRFKNESHVKRLMVSIRKKYLFTLIVVSKDFYVIDGQHRLEALKRLKLKVNYVIMPYTLGEVIQYNTGSKNWNPENYMISYADRGYQHYIDLRKFYNEFKNDFPLGSCRVLLAGIAGDNADKFKNGKWEIKDMTKAREMAYRLREIKVYYANVKRRNFLRSIIDVFNNKDYDHSRMLKKLDQQAGALTDQHTKEAYLKLLTKIYNYRVKDDDRINFLGQSEIE